MKLAEAYSIDLSTPLYGRREFGQPIPKTAIPDTPMAPESAYQLIHDELALDGNPSLNLATFVNTWTDPWGTRLIEENLGKNFIDHEEYPKSNLVEKRLIWMLGELFGAERASGDINPDTAKGFYGSATIGSSEAIMLALIAHRKRWETSHGKNPRAHPLDRPFVLMSTHVHTCWDKYCRYFGVESLYVPMGATKFALTGEDVATLLATPIVDCPRVMDACGYADANAGGGLEGRTVGELVMTVGAVLGTTFTGNSDEVEAIGRAIDAYCLEHTDLHLDIPIHVDGASGGLILPFLGPTPEGGTPRPRFTFDEVPRVYSINVSNHKFGMTLPGMGSVLFRSSGIVPDTLKYDISYLGGSFVDYTVNFSRGTSMILLQYYNVLRWGQQGFRRVIASCMENTKRLLAALREQEDLKGRFEPISDTAHYPICVFAWGERPASWSMGQMVDTLRQRGWIVPSYQLPTDDPHKADGPEVFRIVVRQLVTAEMVDDLVRDLVDVVRTLDETPNAALQSALPQRPRYPVGRVC